MGLPSGRETDLGSTAIVVKQAIRLEAADPRVAGAEIDVQIAVVVEIGDPGPHGPGRIEELGGHRDVGERAVSLVAEQAGGASGRIANSRAARSARTTENGGAPASRISTATSDESTAVTSQPAAANKLAWRPRPQARSRALPGFTLLAASATSPSGSGSFSLRTLYFSSHKLMFAW